MCLSTVGGNQSTWTEAGAWIWRTWKLHTERHWLTRRSVPKTENIEKQQIGVAYSYTVTYILHDHQVNEKLNLMSSFILLLIHLEPKSNKVCFHRCIKQGSNQLNSFLTCWGFTHMAGITWTKRMNGKSGPKTTKSIAAICNPSEWKSLQTASVLSAKISGEYSSVVCEHKAVVTPA